jgi:hypothetical protein
MDDDPAVEPELDSFSLTLPLPYRVALVVVLGTFSLYGVALLMLIGKRRLGMGRKSALSFSC